MWSAHRVPHPFFLLKISANIIYHNPAWYRFHFIPWGERTSSTSRSMSSEHNVLNRMVTLRHQDSIEGMSCVNTSTYVVSSLSSSFFKIWVAIMNNLKLFFSTFRTLSNNNMNIISHLSIIIELINFISFLILVIWFFSL